MQMDRSAGCLSKYVDKGMYRWASSTSYARAEQRGKHFLNWLKQHGALVMIGEARGSQRGFLVGDMKSGFLLCRLPSVF